jgi:hypothetical protein
MEYYSRNTVTGIGVDLTWAELGSAVAVPSSDVHAALLSRESMWTTYAPKEHCAHFSDCVVVLLRRYGAQGGGRICFAPRAILVMMSVLSRGPGGPDVDLG